MSNRYDYPERVIPQRCLFFRLGYGLALILTLLNSQSCNGSTQPGTSPPPVSTFTIFDAPGAQIAGFGTFPIAINADGVIVGYFSDASQVVHSFVRSTSGTMSTFDAPNAGTGKLQGTFPAAINSASTIAGYYVGQDGSPHGFTRDSNGSFTFFDVPTPSRYTVPMSIDDNADTTGYFGDMNGGLHGFFRSVSGAITTFDAPGASTMNGAGTIAHEIESTGGIVGMFNDANLAFHGFLRAPDGTFTVLDAPGAGTGVNSGTIAYSINASGTVVGAIQITTPSAGHSFLRTSSGNYSVFDSAITRAQYSWAYGVNDSGTIVGTYSDGTEAHGYLRNPDGTFVVLDAPNAATPGGTFAEAINAHGAVIGHYLDAQSITHGFVYQ